jgi:DnaK suppressor protein
MAKRSTKGKKAKPKKAVPTKHKKPVLKNKLVKKEKSTPKKVKSAKKTAKKISKAPKLLSAVAKKLKQLPAPFVSQVKPYHAAKNEEYMNKLQREHFRKVLLSWKRELLNEMERTVHHMQDEAANFPDPNDRATQEEEFSLELRARDRERKLIKKIDETISRIDNNDYGYCDACGVEIGISRLEARPTATLCIDCKTIDEIREKHYN